MHKSSRTLTGILCFGYAFLYTPLVYLVVFSFNDIRHGSLWGGFSFKWYQSIWHNKTLLDAAWVSLKVATLSATLAVMLGTLSAFALVRTGRFKTKGLFSALTRLPLILPEVVLGLSFLLGLMGLRQFTGGSLESGILSIVIAHATVGIAYVVILVRDQLLDLDERLFEAARDLGATSFRILCSITLPLLMPAIKTSWCLAFLLSFDDVVIASFVAGPDVTTLPMAVFSMVRFGMTPEVNVLGSIFMGLMVLVMGVFVWVKHLQRPT